MNDPIVFCIVLIALAVGFVACCFLVRRGDGASERLRTDPDARSIAMAYRPLATQNSRPIRRSPYVESAAATRRLSIAGHVVASGAHAAADAWSAARRAAVAAYTADADATQLERLAAHAERNAHYLQLAEHGAALDYRERAKQARQQAALAVQWAEEAKDYAERALERAGLAAVAKRESGDLLRHGRRRTLVSRR
ncbi:hypothetical protein [Burkholderia alba]|uniref:hypothetical protein n=1 Tax=Burkholderia alba TaxID=2683677 RepID=UPI002B05FD12|nr:hypothetical protein [Burkholderia alba]